MYFKQWVRRDPEGYGAGRLICFLAERGSNDEILFHEPIQFGYASDCRGPGMSSLLYQLCTEQGDVFMHVPCWHSAFVLAVAIL